MEWYDDGIIRMKKLIIPPYGTNCYIVACPITGEAVVIDTPGAAARILRESKELKVRYIIITHTHSDHLGAFTAVRTALGVPAIVHSTEAVNLPFPADSLVVGGETINFGTLRLNVLHTPGHSPGSICLYTPGHLFSGDTIFPGGPGNTSSPKTFKQIVKSITQKLFSSRMIQRYTRGMVLRLPSSKRNRTIHRLPAACILKIFTVMYSGYLLNLFYIVGVLSFIVNSPLFRFSLRPH